MELLCIQVKRLPVLCFIAGWVVLSCRRLYDWLVSRCNHKVVLDRQLPWMPIALVTWCPASATFVVPFNDPRGCSADCQLHRLPDGLSGKGKKPTGCFLAYVACLLQPTTTGQSKVEGHIRDGSFYWSTRQIPWWGCHETCTGGRRSAVLVCPSASPGVVGVATVILVLLQGFLHLAGL